MRLCSYHDSAFIEHGSSECVLPERQHSTHSQHRDPSSLLPCPSRNNHYSVVFKRNAMLYLLVTDLGYLNEKDVVWERLDGVDGDTQLCDGGFEPFRPHRASASGRMLAGKQL